MIPQEGSTQMLDCVHFRRVHDRFVVRGGHAKIERSDDFRSDMILSGYIDARLQFDVVYGKAGNFFHIKILLSVSIKTLKQKAVSVKTNSRIQWCMLEIIAII